VWTDAIRVPGFYNTETCVQACGLQANGAVSFPDGRVRLKVTVAVGTEQSMSLYRVVYASQPFGFDDGMLNSILADARRCNVRDGITGALICRADLYLQWLEGPDQAVRDAYARIAGDDRHQDVRCLLAGPVDERLFPAWAMRHDPAHSWIWTPAEVAEGALHRTDGDAIQAVFAAIAVKPSTD